MTKELWINLPVKDVKRTTEFFTSLGFSFNLKRTNDDMGCMPVGENKYIVMFFREPMFENFTKNKIADTQKCSEVLFSFSAETKAEVDEMAKKVVMAGGTVFGQPGGNDQMYGCGFSDPDGHRWNMLYMNM